MNEHVTTGDSALLEGRVAAWLHDEGTARAPDGFLDGVLATLDRAPGLSVRRRLVGLVPAPEWLGVAMALFLVAVLIGGTVLLSGFGGGRSTAGAGGAPAYEGIHFRADGLVITVPGGQFTLDPAAATVHSDPGSSEYRTLEFTWQQAGVEMRLFIYFASDGRDWWVSEIRTYDGRARGGWITYNPDWRLPLGVAFDGPVTLTGGPGKAGGMGQLRIARLVLLPTFPARIRAATTGPTSGPNGDISPFAPGQVLNCIGAEDMTAQEIALYARSHGYATSYRYETTDPNTGIGTGEISEPPVGSVLTGAAWGVEGELVIFAVAPDEPFVDQMRLTAERACPAAGAGK